MKDVEGKCFTGYTSDSTTQSALDCDEKYMRAGTFMQWMSLSPPTGAGECYIAQQSGGACKYDGRNPTDFSSLATDLAAEMAVNSQSYGVHTLSQWRMTTGPLAQNYGELLSVQDQSVRQAITKTYKQMCGAGDPGNYLFHQLQTTSFAGDISEVAAVNTAYQTRIGVVTTLLDVVETATPPSATTIVTTGENNSGDVDEDEESFAGRRLLSGSAWLQTALLSLLAALTVSLAVSA
jgi:hypothetical protein